MKLRERIIERPELAVIKPGIQHFHHRLLGRAAPTWTRRGWTLQLLRERLLNRAQIGPTLQLLRERLLGRALSTRYERDDDNPAGAQGEKTQNEVP